MIRPATNAVRPGADGSDQQLEADVMRFVAIIALCIVAISTLVENTPPPAPAVVEEPESVPVATTPPVPSPPMVAAPPASPPESVSARAGGAVAITSDRRAVAQSAAPSVLPQQRPRPAVSEPRPRSTEPALPPVTIVHERDTDPGVHAADTARAGAGSEDVVVTIDPQQSDESAVPVPLANRAAVTETNVDESPATAAPVVEPAADAPPAEAPSTEPPSTEPPSIEPPSDELPPDEPGFTLRFASDAALLRLVGRGEAGLYVFDEGATLRLDYGPNGAAFAPAPGPGQYHEIAAATVPRLLRRTLAQRERRSADVVWGVTLPSSTRAALARLISDHRSGELVIDERGRVRLETSHDRT